MIHAKVYLHEICSICVTFFALLMKSQKPRYRSHLGGKPSIIWGVGMERFCALQRGVWVFEGCGDPKWGRIILFYISIQVYTVIFQRKLVQSNICVINRSVEFGIVINVLLM